MQQRVADQAVRAWLESRDRRVHSLDWLPGDVSPRRYARVALDTGSAAIVAWYPIEHRAILDRYTAATRIVADAGIRVPAILEEDAGKGLMLLEDLGPRTLFEEAADQTTDELEACFAQAVDLIALLESIPPERVRELNPPLDGPLLRRELELTIQHAPLPGRLTGRAAEARRFRAALDALCDALEAAPKTVCHRDFMVRNLIRVGGRIAVIDHQDVRLGPRGYDLASLLNDSLYPPSGAEARLLVRALGEDEQLTYRRAAAQRTLKALGTFARAAANGSAKHRRLIDPTMERALACMANAPETEAIAEDLAGRRSR